MPQWIAYLPRYLLGDDGAQVLDGGRLEAHAHSAARLVEALAEGAPVLHQSDRLDGRATAHQRRRVQVGNVDAQRGVVHLMMQLQQRGLGW